MKKFVSFVSALLVLVSLSGVGASASQRKSKVSHVRTVRVTKSNMTASMKIALTKTPTQKYLGISSREAMRLFNSNQSANQLKKSIGKNSSLNYRTATKRFANLVNGFQNSLKRTSRKSRKAPKTYKLYF